MNLFKWKENDNFCKPVKTKEAFEGKYIEYESKGNGYK